MRAKKFMLPKSIFKTTEDDIFTMNEKVNTDFEE
jgi:hypothetical protein